MKKTLFSLLIILISFSYQAQKITIGKTNTIKSNILKEKRDFYVYVPPKFDERDKNKKYPVLYLLDGETHFHSVASMVRQLASFDERFMEMIVVGIPNTNRFLNLSHHQISEFRDTKGWESLTGGGKDFEAFMENELFPFIERKYPALDHRTLIGHSLGGLFAMHVLYENPDLFDNYIALDPSLWWGKKYLMEHKDEIINNIKSKSKSLYVGIANTLNYGVSLKEAMNDSTLSNEHIDCIYSFVNSAKDQLNQTDRFFWKYYPDEDHGSVPTIASYHAFKSLFSWYEFKEIAKFYDSTTTIKEFESSLNEHITKVSNNLGYQYIPSATEVNWWTELLSGEHQLYKAQVVLQLNIDNFPNHALSYSQLADSYLATKDTTKAIEYYEKSIELGRNMHVKTQLEKIKATNKE